MFVKDFMNFLFLCKDFLPYGAFLMSKFAALFHFYVNIPGSEVLNTYIHTYIQYSITKNICRGR